VEKAKKLKNPLIAEFKLRPVKKMKKISVAGFRVE
jgi:hypothetical protein